MGVPAFYRWLSTRYPKIVVDVIEEHPEEVNGVSIPVDTSQPNPQGVEFDNLYLDMNGIIHPCFHPEDRPAPTTELEVFDNIFDYIDRLFGMIRPRKLIYMAIDGVAPRAKMNQQRSRRFRAAQEAEEKEKEEEELRMEYAKQGIKIPKKEKSEVCDSNTITPGTPFMHRLAIALQYYVHLRLNSDPGWRDVKVILSDSNSPGEGEHKVMEYIRQQRNRPGTDPNTKHVVYGLDADLIMLALATHEPHFYILREVIMPNPPSGATKPGFTVNANGDLVEEDKAETLKKPFQLLQVAILREYLNLEFKCELPFERDPERELDDLVFMCFFCGNDFLPHSPSLEIREGAIELLMATYKRMLPELGGYLTFGGEVNMERVEHFIAEVSKAEEAIFARRARMLESQKRRRQRDKDIAAQQRARAQARPTAEGSREVAPVAKGPADQYRHKAVMLEPEGLRRGPSSSAESNKDAASALRARLAGTKRGADDEEADGTATKAAKTDENESPGKAEAAEEVGGVETQETAEECEDNNKKAAEEFKSKMEESLKSKTDMFDSMIEDEKKIRLGEGGWRERYYKEKLGVPEEKQEATVRDMVRAYIEGVCWVMRYYYDGVASWAWYYPYHYAPFASDLKDLGSIKISFDLGKPFKPFNQLMGVLPAASSHALPKPFQWLFSDPESPLLDFYPKDFAIDINGKRFAWQAVCLLPFIDAQRLVEVTEGLEDQLSEEEKFRNSNRLELMYVGPAHSLVPTIYELQDQCPGTATEEERIERRLQLDAEASGGMAGYIALTSTEPCPPVMPAPFGMGDDITSNGAMGVTFMNPDRQDHLPKLQEGAMLPRPVVTEADLPPPKALWHEDTPRHMRGGPGRGRGYDPHQQNNRPMSLADSAHRHLNNALAAGGRGGYNPYTGGYGRGQGGPPPGGGYGPPGGPPRGPPQGAYMGGPRGPPPGGYSAPPGAYGGPPPGHFSGRGPPGGFGYGGRGMPPPQQHYMGRGGPPQHYGGQPSPQYMGMGGPRGPVAPHQLQHGGPPGHMGNNPYAALQRPAQGRGRGRHGGRY